MNIYHSIGDFEIDWILECVWELKFGTSPWGSYWVFTFSSSESSLSSKSLMLHIPHIPLLLIINYYYYYYTY